MATPFDFVLVEQHDVFTTAQANACGITRGFVRAQVAAGRWQGGPPDVVTEIEMRVIDPDRSSEPERHRVQFLPVARHQRQAPGQEGQELLMGRRGPSNTAIDAMAIDV